MLVSIMAAILLTDTHDSRYWLYFAPGSGIYFDLGKTAVFFGGYIGACIHFMNGNESAVECLGAGERVSLDPSLTFNSLDTHLKAYK